MLGKFKKLFKGSEQAQAEEITERADLQKARPLTPEELETFKKGMGITPHNYWTWAGRTNNFKLLTDGQYVWVEGFEDHVGRRMPLTQAKAWSWEFVKERIRDFGGEG